MATTKKVTKVSNGESSHLTSQKQAFIPTAEAKGKAKKLRLFAVLFWILAFAAEAGAIYVLIKSAKPIETNTWIWLIGLIVVDLILVIVGSQIWKKSNRLDPASKSDKTRFFIQNQLGVIISVIAFLPLVLLIFTNKNLDGKQKGILSKKIKDIFPDSVNTLHIPLIHPAYNLIGYVQESRFIALFFYMPGKAARRWEWDRISMRNSRRQGKSLRKLFQVLT